MPIITSLKNLRKMLEPFLEEGETLGGITFQGGFKKCTIAATDHGRILVTTLPFFSSKAKPLKEIRFDAVTRIDLYPMGSSACLVIASAGETTRFKIPAGLFDTFNEAAKIYHAVTLNNPGANPEYVPAGESVEFMVKTDAGVLKLTERTLLLLEPDKEGVSLALKLTVPVAAVTAVDCYPGKMTASFLWLKHANGENLLKIGSVIVGLGSAFDAVFSKGSQVMAERLLALLIERNPAARPAYLEGGETMLATARVGHSRMSIVGGSFLRATDRRLLELEAEKSGALTVKLSLPYDGITGGTLTTIRNQNSVQYELQVQTTAGKHKFVADGDYEEQMKLMRDRINKNL